MTHTNTNTNNINSSNSSKNFLFFCGLFYLIFVCFFGSLINSIVFLSTQNYTNAGSLLGRSLFLLFFVIYLIKPQFGTNFIQGIINNSTVKILSNSIYNLQNILKNYSFPFFLLIHIYLCFFLLHWFCIWTNSVDPYLEFGFHFFNMLRLVIFPLIIFFYILNNLESVVPSHHLIVGNIKEYLEVAKELYHGVSDFSKKNPKISTTAALSTAVLAGVALDGASTSKYIKNCENNPSLTGLKNLPVEQCINERSREIRQNLEHVIQESEKSPLIIGFNNMSRALNNRAPLDKDYDRLTHEIKLFKWEQMDLKPSLTGTAVSHALNSSKNNDVSDAVDNNNTTSDLTQIEAPSIIESKMWFCNYFF